MNHWAEQYIGTPWSYGATGPESFDCWGFFKHVQLHHYNIVVQDIASPKTWAEAHKMMEHHEERQKWIQVMRPTDGCAVMLARNRVPVHIGIWLVTKSSNGVLHCAQPVGVVYQSLNSLRVSGWGHLTFYRHTQ